MASLFSDLKTVLLLIGYSIISSIEVFLKNYILPKKKNESINKRLEKQVVLITGAAGGIGRSLSKKFLKIGCKVICVDINKKDLEKLESELSSKVKVNPFYNKNVFFYNFDITNIEEVKYNSKLIKTQVGNVNILINNAGIMNQAKLFMDLSENEILNIFNVNILSQFWMIREFLPRMLEENKGHIVNVSSSLGFFGAYKLTDYCSTKFAVVGLSEALRVELKSVNPNNNIVVTTVCPFHVKTNLFNGFELDKFKWLNLSNTPDFVADEILDGILRNKYLIGCPKFEFFLMAAVKNLVTTSIQDLMMIWFGFNEAIDKYRTQEAVEKK